MTESTAAAKSQGHFSLQRVYTKDLSFEAPGAPAVFTLEWKPETSVQVNSGANRLADNQFEVLLQVTVTTRLQDKVAFIAEARIAGIFVIEGVESEALERVLGAHCPNILFPYAREVVSDLVNRGSFPQFLLQPMNFESVYTEAKRRRDQQVAGATPTH